MVEQAEEDKVDNNKMLERILNKVDKVDNHLDSINQTLIKQEEQLAYHIKRSDQQDHALQIIEKRLKPVETHIIAINTLVKLFGTFAAVVLFVFSVLNFFTSK